MTRQALLIVGFLVAAFPLQSSVAQQQKVGAPPEASNMRLVGFNDLQARSAYQPVIHARATAGSPTSAITAAGRTESADRRARSTTAPRSSTSPIPRKPRYLRTSRARKARARPAARRWCGCATAASCPRATASKVYLLRTFGNSAHEMWDVDRPGEAGAGSTVVERPAGHAQELVGVRHRHRLPRLGRARLAHAPHDAGLRPQRSGEAGAHPRLRPASARSRASTGDRCRPSCTARSPRAEGQPRLLRLRHQRGRRRCRSSIARSC